MMDNGGRLRGLLRQMHTGERRSPLWQRLAFKTFRLMDFFVCFQCDGVLICDRTCVSSRWQRKSRWRVDVQDFQTPIPRHGANPDPKRALLSTRAFLFDNSSRRNPKSYGHLTAAELGTHLIVSHVCRRNIMQKDHPHPYQPTDSFQFSHLPKHRSMAEHSIFCSSDWQRKI